MKRDLNPDWPIPGPRSHKETSRMSPGDRAGESVAASSLGESIDDECGPDDDTLADDLRQRVRLFLAASNLPGLRRIDIQVDGDTVTLQGRVRTFYEKQLAAEFSRRVAGVIQIVDQIEVRGYEPHADVGHDSAWRRDSTAALRCR